MSRTPMVTIELGELARRNNRITELEAELEATVTECMAAKSNEDILRAKLERLARAMLYAIGEIHCDCRKGYNCAVCVLTEALGEKGGE